MSDLKIHQNPTVETKFLEYPETVYPRMAALRELVLEVAAETEGVNALEETLKWGEPSYIAKKGSTLRMDWKAKAPDQYALYFKCTSKLVPTFQEIFGDLFRYENTRAILFGLEEDIPREELKTCIRMALTYHSVKHLPLLGWEGNDPKS